MTRTTPLLGECIVRATTPETVPPSLREKLRTGIPAHLPGEVMADLLHQDLVADPFDGSNEAQCQWVSETAWRYELEFNYERKPGRVVLVAKNVDTVATFSLAGRPFAHTENFHRTYRFDVTEMLSEGTNHLTIDLEPPVTYAERKEAERGYYPHTEHHPFNQIRKPAYAFGWDWGIDTANCGIVGGLWLEHWEQVRIASVVPIVDVRGNVGVLDAKITIERDLPLVSAPHLRPTGQPVEVAVELTRRDRTYKATTVIPRNCDNTTVSVEVPQVELWWPIGYGEQPLYDLKVWARCSTHEVTSELKVGFRTVSVSTGADQVGRPFEISVNGTRIHCRGWNWIPADALISRVTRDHYEQAAVEVRESNANMIRVWGGGLYEPDDFYDVMDREGILVWQDFAFACAAYPEDPQTIAEVTSEAREQIRRLSSHPSVIVWNGSNENYVAYAEWDGFKESLRADSATANRYGYGEKGWGRRYYDELFPALLEDIDPSRIYLPSSPMSFTPFTAANLDTDGTCHIWDVWNREDYRKYAQYQPRFCDEFGYQAPPAWSTLTSVVHDDPFDPFGEQMMIHQKASGGNQKLARGMRCHLTPGTIDDVCVVDGEHSWLIPTDSFSDPEDWHWACQLQQAHAIKFGVEHMRSLGDINAGCLIWQLNDDWPVVSWSAVDYAGIRKPMWYAAARAFAPRFSTIQPRVSEQARRWYSWEGKTVDPDHLALIAVNDTKLPWSARWQVTRLDLDGTVCAEEQFEAEVSALGNHTIALPPSLSDLQNGQYLRVSGSSEAWYSHQEIFASPLEPNPLRSRVEPIPDGYRVTVTASSLARDVTLLVDKAHPQARVDKALVTIEAGQRASFTVTCPRLADPQVLGSPQILRCANEFAAWRWKTT